MLDQIRWVDGHARVKGYDYLIQESGNFDASTRDRLFRLYKAPGLLQQYGRFWKSIPHFQPRRILELGIWDGGSTALWFEYFDPEQLVAIDYSNRGDSAYFKQFLLDQDRTSRISTHWAVDQGDRARVQQIVASEFKAPLDLIIDDASHQYNQTKASFETLFPMLRRGGMYIIEDWAHRWLTSPTPDVYRNRTPLHQLVLELVRVTGTTWLIESTSIHQGFAVIERGEAEIAQPASFRLPKAPPSLQMPIG